MKNGPDKAFGVEQRVTITNISVTDYDLQKIELVIPEILSEHGCQPPESIKAIYVGTNHVQNVFFHFMTYSFDV